MLEQVKDEKFMKTVDLIWDNPPYTSPETKERVLRALVASNKPFSMLLPISILHVGFVREIVNTQHVCICRTSLEGLSQGSDCGLTQVQVIIPRRVNVCKTGQDEVPFKYLCWFCYRMGLPRDLYFVDDLDRDNPE